MISNPDLIYYTCISRKTTILAQFAKESDLEELVRKCIEKVPPFHSMFSHTVRKRTYTFLINDPFVYFSIFDEKLRQSEGLWFLNRIKSGFEEMIKGGLKKSFDLSTSCSFQAEFDSILREIMVRDVDLVNSPPSLSNGSLSSSLDASKGKKLVFTPLLGGKANKGLKKKKRSSGDGNGDFGKDVENKVDVFDEANGVSSRDFSSPMQKNVSHYVGDQHKAKQVWRKHVWVVLLLDLFVCSILFGIWLWVCRGFKCIDS
ncbi:hypothetical protein UlMin_024331 [Ulmus minor]